MATNVISPLRAGDCLTRDEFERRYEASDVSLAELIDGIVYMPSPATHRHADPHTLMILWVRHYAAYTDHVEALAKATVRLDYDNEIQPDVLVRRTEQGTSHIDEDDYVSGPPELIAEIAYSSASYDLHQKKDVCRRHGVREYLVWTVEDNVFSWFVLEEGRYGEISSDVTESVTFPGLVLDRAALLRGDDRQVLATLQEGLDAR